MKSLIYHITIFAFINSCQAEKINKDIDIIENNSFFKG